MDPFWMVFGAVASNAAIAPVILSIPVLALLDSRIFQDSATD
jgi:hypothetical protein